MAQDIFYDKVESITEVSNDRPWVYDLTVEGTRNFNAYLFMIHVTAGCNEMFGICSVFKFCGFSKP